MYALKYCHLMENLIRANLVLKIYAKHLFNGWEILGKVKVIVTDNARNVVNAIRNIQGVDHYPCMAHSLQLVLQNSCLNKAKSKTWLPLQERLLDILATQRRQ
jgi:hypothetical protein